MWADFLSHFTDVVMMDEREESKEQQRHSNGNNNGLSASAFADPSERRAEGGVGGDFDNEYNGNNSVLGGAGVQESRDGGSGGTTRADQKRGAE